MSELDHDVPHRRRGDMAGMAGIGVDARGGPVLDPTANVIALVEAGHTRQDDLREMTDKYLEAQVQALKELGNLRAEHQRDLDALEAKRLDAVRTVDQLTAKTEADRSAAAVSALAAAAATTAETLRSAVNTSATNLATQLDRTVTAITERIASLEKSSYTGQGKQAVSDPQLELMVSEMRKLSARTDEAGGKSSGINAVWLVVVAAVGLLGTLVMMGAVAVTLVLFIARGATPVVASPTPQVIYVPAPAGALLPTTTPPGTVR